MEFATTISQIWKHNNSSQGAAQSVQDKIKLRININMLDFKYIEIYLYFLKKVGNVFIVKWKGATEKSIKNNATAPYIYLRASI